MTERRIGLIGGMSWESTRTYYSLLNELTAASLGPWHQPLVLVDSLDFSEIVGLQRAVSYTHLDVYKRQMRVNPW